MVAVLDTASGSSEHLSFQSSAAQIQIQIQNHVDLIYAGYHRILRRFQMRNCIKTGPVNHQLDGGIGGYLIYTVSSRRCYTQLKCYSQPYVELERCSN